MAQDYERLRQLGFDRHSVFVESRYQWIKKICSEVITYGPKKTNYTDKIDAVVTHKFWGYIIFFALMTLMFQSIFTWATVPMDFIGALFDRLGKEIAVLLPPGDLRDLLIHGIINGTGAVITFLPQIALLFLFLGFLKIPVIWHALLLSWIV